MPMDIDLQHPRPSRGLRISNDIVAVFENLTARGEKDIGETF
jgi:hypothetical protein